MATIAFKDTNGNTLPVSSSNPLAGLSLTGVIKDNKDDLNTFLTINTENSNVDIHSILGLTLDIDLKERTTNNLYKVILTKYLRNAPNNDKTINFRIGQDASMDTDGTGNVTYPFQNNTDYKLLFTFKLQSKTSPSSVYYVSAIYYFRYFVNPVSLTDFTFNSNIMNGDEIKISGLFLDKHGPSTSPTYADDTTTPERVYFSFQEAEKIGDTDNSEPNTVYSPDLPYEPSGEYTLPANELHNDRIYKVSAIAVWEAGHVSDNATSSQNMYVIERPVIAELTAYDVQNDGGNDGNSGADSNNQTITTIGIAQGYYEVIEPDFVTFIFSLASDPSGNEVANAKRTASGYVFNNSQLVNLYNLKLSDITLASNTLQGKLVNGTEYMVRAMVNFSGDADLQPTPQIRYSDPVSITFSQDVAPVIDLQISNTWALSTTDNPSSNSSNFNASPLIGISGSFRKNAQFDVNNYPRQLDTNNTKFRLEYKVGEGDWSLVTRANLIQKLASETLEAAVNRSISLTTDKADGLYNNIVGSNIGTSQQPLVFYIPQNQSSNSSVAFTESDEVMVRVTVVDTAELWTGNNEASLDSSSLQLINKINTYSFNNGTSSEPWNTVNEISYNKSTGLLSVSVNGSIITTNKSNVLADSDSIITEEDDGWHVLNTGVGTNGARSGVLPKVNLYYYANSVSAQQQTSSNSFAVNNLSGLGTYVVIDQQQNAKEYPFIVIYTTPTASNNKAGWYKSKLFYAPTLSGNTISDSSKVGLTLLYTGTDDQSMFSDIPSTRRVKCDLLPHDGTLTNANSGYSTELVNRVSLQTSSNASTSQAGNFNFILSEVGLTTNSSVMTSQVMRFARQIILNIPVDWNSIHANSVIVKYRYNTTDQYVTETFNYDNSMDPQYVSFAVNPNLSTTLYYTVAYVVNNTNLSTSPQTTQGLTTSELNIPNKFFPLSSDYNTASNAYKTINTDGEASISFNLNFTCSSVDRIDGVNVYLTSTDSTTGSDIEKTRIGSYTAAQGGAKTITLLSSDVSLLLNVMDNTGNVVTIDGLTWDNYDSAEISFEAYRDARVNSDNASYDTTFYVESGVNNFSKTIWNVPVLTNPRDDGLITLDGGVINALLENSTVVNWVVVNDDNDLPFTYDLVMTKNDSTQIHNESNLTVDNYTLDVQAPSAVAKYTVTIKKVFNGLISQRELSSPDTIVFHTIKVDTSSMNVAVENPSNVQVVNLSWAEPVITGNNLNVSGNVVASNFDDNIYAHNIVYRTSPSDNLVRLNNSVNLIERILSPNTKKEYVLPDNVLGTLYEFYMYVEAQVKYSVNGSVLTTKSSPVSVPLTNKTYESQYTLSTIPSVTLPIDAPVLILGQPNPVLLLNLNANGLEDEGFISVVVVLTQDGTPEKPDGEQALVLFPDSGSNISVAYLNSIQNSGAGPSDPSLGGGDSATSLPRNLTNSVVSSQNSAYTLTIGTPGDNGRYGLSTLVMPSSVNSGFLDSGNPNSSDYNPINYMVIATTRRGTDIQAGQFRYEILPVITNVEVTTTNGQYYVNFNVSPA